MTKHLPPPPPTSVTLANLGEMLTVGEAALLVGCHVQTIRRAMYRGELDAIAPAGRDPRHFGRMGWRIQRDELLRWYTGKPKEA